MKKILLVGFVIILLAMTFSVQADNMQVGGIEKVKIQK